MKVIAKLKYFDPRTSSIFYRNSPISMKEQVTTPPSFFTIYGYLLVHGIKEEAGEAFLK